MNDVGASERLTADTPIVGQSARRPAVDRFTRGRGVYIADIELRDVLHVALARSSIAHGQILRIDGDEARASLYSTVHGAGRLFGRRPSAGSAARKWMHGCGAAASS